MLNEQDNNLIKLTHSAEDPYKYYNAVVPPVCLTSLHVYDTFEEYANIDATRQGEYVYGRSSNPTVSILESKLAQLENGKKALAFSSGMAAATSAIMAVCKAGDHIICLRDVYQPVKRFLNNYAIPNLNITVTYVEGVDLVEVEQAIKPNTSLIILESPATFVFTVFDIKAIVKIAKKHNIKTYIDNTYCTPLYQNPLDLGVDIVMHTMSKYIGGHSDIIGGALVSNDEQLMIKIATQIREWYGGIIGPMEGWLAMRGLRTLSVRVEQHYKNAMAVATYLENHSKVKKVNYTGLASHPQAELIKNQQSGHTGLMSFELDAAPEKAVELINNMKLFGKGCSWGGFESLALCPLYNADNEELEFLNLKESRGLIRIHCGLEGENNLLQDLENAFAKI